MKGKGRARASYSKNTGRQVHIDHGNPASWSSLEIVSAKMAPAEWIVAVAKEETDRGEERDG